MVLAVVVLLGFPQDLDSLIQQLRSSDPKVREGAAANLVARGPNAIPHLKGFETDPDAEVRARVSQVIQEISRRERVSSVRPYPIRVSLKLSDVALPEALEKVLPSFGLKLDDRRLPDLLTKRLVTIDLQQAMLWQALDAIERSAKVDINASAYGVEVRNQRREPAREWVCDAVDIRLTLIIYIPEPQEKDDRPAEIRVIAALPVASAPLWWNVEDVVLTDDQARAIPIRVSFPYEKGRDGSLRTKLGVLTKQEIWKGNVTPHLLRKAKRVRFSGKVVVKYPRDVVRHKFRIRDTSDVVSRVVNGVKCTFDVKRRKDSQYFNLRETYVPVEAGPKRKYVLWAEDARERWFGDLSGAVLGGPVGGESGGGGGPYGDGKTRLAQLVLAELIGEERVEFPFDFKGVVPPLPQ